MDKKNAEKGKKYEKLFKNSVKNHPEVIEALKAHFKITGNFTVSFPTGPEGKKTDVILQFSDGRSLNANIKSFGKPGFNQATRGKIKSFCNNLDFQSIENILEQAVIRKARKGKFILKDDEETVKKIISPSARKLIDFSLSNSEKPQLLVIYDILRNIMYLYDMADVLTKISYEVSFSAAGNVQIGKYFLFHRKGGDGGNKRFEKTALEHPGNNLAVKLFCKKLISDVEPIVTYSPKK